MESHRNPHTMQNPPNAPIHYGLGPEADFHSMSPWGVIDDGVYAAFNRNHTPGVVSNYPFSLDEVESVSDAFSSLGISYGSRNLLPVSLDGEIAGGGSPIGSGEGSVTPVTPVTSVTSVHPFRSDSGVDEGLRGLNGINAGDRYGRVYSSVGQSSPLTVDPHLHQYDQYPRWLNREVRCSSFDQSFDRSFDRFDQSFDFDQTYDMLLKEQLYCKQQLNSHYLFSSNSSPRASVNNNSVSKSVFDNANSISNNIRNHQLVSLWSLKELRGRIYTLAKDQNGCRLLQAKFENPTKEEVEFVLYEVLDSIADLMKDQFGNYLIQKLISVCNDDHKLRILLSLTDSPREMVLVCMSPHGTRAMQKLLENLTDRYQIALAMAALRPGAARLANDPNGHHVIQYCLIHFPSDVNEPILNEIADKCYAVATDRSGCCVLQACMEHSNGKVRNRLFTEILRNAVILAEDPYGNYVLQHMVGLRIAEFTARLVRQLKGNFASLSCNKYASNVVEKCLNESTEDIAIQIVMELIMCSNPSLLLTDPYANFVIQSALTVSTGYVYECLVELISDNMSSMRSNLYGKKILAWFEKRRILAI